MSTPDPKEPWWESGWFWGGIAPLLPVAAVIISVLVGLKPSEMIWLVALAAAPIVIFVGLASLGMAAEAWRESVFERGSQKTLVLIAVAIGLIVLVGLAMRPSCEDWIEGGRYGQQRVCVR